MFHQSRSNYYNVVENDRDLTEDYRVLGEGAGRGREGEGVRIVCRIRDQKILAETALSARAQGGRKRPE